MAIEESVTRDAASRDDDFLAATGGIDGFFTLSASKVVSIVGGQPFEGWVTLAFTDEGDQLGFNNQMFYVPEPMFYNTVKHWLNSKGITWED